MNDTCKERIGNRDYVTFGADTEIPYGLLSTDSNTVVLIGGYISILRDFNLETILGCGGLRFDIHDLRST